MYYYSSLCHEEKSIRDHEGSLNLPDISYFFIKHWINIRKNYAKRNVLSLFIKKDGSPIDERNLSSHFKKVFMEQGYDITFYDIRRFFVTYSYKFMTKDQQDLFKDIINTDEGSFEMNYNRTNISESSTNFLNALNEEILRPSHVTFNEIIHIDYNPNVHHIDYIFDSKVIGDDLYYKVKVKELAKNLSPWVKIEDLKQNLDDISTYECLENKSILRDDVNIF